MILASKSIMPTLVFPICSQQHKPSKCLFQYLMFHKTRDYLLSFRVKTFSIFQMKHLTFHAKKHCRLAQSHHSQAPEPLSLHSRSRQHVPQKVDIRQDTLMTSPKDLEPKVTCQWNSLAVLATLVKSSNACDGLPCEETTFLGSLFENHKYSDEHRAEIGRTMGFLNERKLNSEGATNTDSKGKDFQWLLFFLQAANNKI